MSQASEIPLRRSQRQPAAQHILTYDETGEQTELIVQQMLTQEVEKQTEGCNVPSEIFCLPVMFPEDTVHEVNHLL